MTIHLLSFAGVMKSVGSILLAILILLVMVTVHEFGHYVAGRTLGFKINEFSVGFGPAIFKKRSKKTGELFAVRIIPLGGYCAFDGEDEFEGENEKNEVKEEPFADIQPEKTQNDEGRVALSEEIPQKEEEFPEPQGARFNDQAPWKRIIVLLAGATMNYLLAVVLIILMFACFGRPMYKVMSFHAPGAETETISDVVLEDDLQVGDVIMKIDGKTMYLITDYMDALDGHKQGDRLTVTVLRGEEVKDVYLELKTDADIANLSDTNTLLGAMGIYELRAATEKEGFFQTIGNSFAYSVKIGGTVLRSLGELLTGKLGIDAMGGPITTIKVTSEAASASITSFLNIAAFIGVNLAVFNLLPIPALDGCKTIFCLIEWIRKKPVNRKVETIIHFVGIIFLFGFAILVDILQLF
ncbi:MAG: site-2 protease family protein [Clostridia bacterium]|nr:site-2 protease family protein [Clostridia bacterium]